MDEQTKKCAFCGMVKSVSDFLARPFNSQGTAFQWLCFLGILVIGGWFWNWTLAQILKED